MGPFIQLRAVCSVGRLRDLEDSFRHLAELKQISILDRELLHCDRTAPADRFIKPRLIHHAHGTEFLTIRHLDRVKPGERIFTWFLIHRKAAHVPLSRLRNIRRFHLTDHDLHGFGRELESYQFIRKPPPSFRFLLLPFRQRNQQSVQRTGTAKSRQKQTDEQQVLHFKR
ncbi:MAG TPA: hypothetical protein VM511_12065 [Luteolibacter sp.]|nr:hypothetical protein [Luteolibacter sp.]